MRPGQVTRPGKSPVPPDFLDRSETVTSAVAELAQRFPDYECLIILDRHWKEERITLRSFWQRAKAIQAAFEARGLRKGDTAVLILPTGSELVAAYFGVMMAGGVPALAAVPSNRISDATIYLQLLGSVLRNAGARIVYAEDAVAQMLEASGSELLGTTQLLRIRDVDPRDSASHTARPLPDDLATIQYSSGTTGTPKGVMLSHRAMLNYMRLLRDGVELRSDEVNVNWAPLYHDMGLFGAFLLPLLCGCPTVLIPTMDFLRSPSLWLWAIDAYEGAVSWAPNFAYSICMQRIPDDEIEGLDLSSWRLAFNASEPVLASTVEGFADRFAPYGFRREAMTSAWGLAETVMVATAHPIAEPPLIDIVDRQHLAREEVALPSEEGVMLVATGKALPNCEIQVRDAATGERLDDRHVGELWLRSNCLFDGYRGDPELTASVLSKGWLSSGDRGYMVDGHVFFVSRAKDLIVIGGEKYAPHDIETAVNRVSGVREGCVVAFGVQNQEQGTEELGVVAETREEGPEALQELARAVRAEVARSIGLGIRHLHLVPPGGISKTTSGKLARAATRARYPEVFGDGC